jgi:hypothetical protein
MVGRFLSTVCAMLLALGLAFSGGWLTAAVASTAVEHVGQAKQKKPAQKKPAKKKQTKKTKPAKAKPAEPEIAKEPWQLPMTVVVVRQIGSGCEPLCAEWIAAEGEITAATPALFRKMLKRLGKRKLPVLIQSPGGNVDAAIEIGRMLRKAKLDVTVSGIVYEGCKPHVKSCRPPEADQGLYRGMPGGIGYCASACPLILAGGVNRLAGTDAGVGLHQIRTTWTRQDIRYRETYRIENGKKKVISRKVVSRKNKSYTKDGLDKRLRRQLTAYLKEMGVSPAMLEDMEKAPHSDMNWLKPERAREVKLVTSHATSVGWFDLLRLCKAADPEPHCIERAFAAPKPAPGAEMIVTRMRATGACEPFCPEWIAAYGVIMPETPKRLAAVLKELDGKKLPIFINSTHGDFDAALDMGRMIREKKLVAAVGVTDFTGCNPRDAACSKDHPPGKPYEGLIYRFGDCGRECLLVLAGGVERYAINAVGTFFAPPESLFSRKTGGPPAKLLEAYLNDMSISPDLLRLARAGTAGKPVRLSTSDVRVLRLGTHQESPDFMADPVSCRGSNPAPNCVARVRPPASAEAVLPPPVGNEMIVVRMRAEGDCGTLCPEWIMAQGMITPQTPERFRAIFKETAGAKLPLVVDSAGGDLDAALAIGRMIRVRKLDVIVATIKSVGCAPRDQACSSKMANQPYMGITQAPGNCSRECLFMLAGGVRRSGVLLSNTVIPQLSEFSTRRSDRSAREIIALHLEDMGTSWDILQNGLSTGSSAKELDGLTAPTACSRPGPPANCIRRDKTS